jgi:hypothetical protein
MIRLLVLAFQLFPFPGPGLPGGVGGGGGGTVATPTDSPGMGTYSTTQTVTLMTTTAAATICYTTDGSTPAATTPGTCSTGTTYSAGFSVAATTTVKAIGTKAGLTNSGVLTSVYTISAGGGTSFVTGQTLGSITNSLGTAVCLGFAFLTQASPAITINQLGRWVVSGNTASHVLSITDLNGTSLASCTVNTSGQTAGQFIYCSVTPTALTGTTQYRMFSHETNGGDSVYNDTNTSITATSVATLQGSIYATGGTSPDCTGIAGSNAAPFTYGPLDFKYQ